MASQSTAHYLKRWIPIIVGLLTIGTFLIGAAVSAGDSHWATREHVDKQLQGYARNETIGPQIQQISEDVKTLLELHLYDPIPPTPTPGGRSR